MRIVIILILFICHVFNRYAMIVDIFGYIFLTFFRKEKKKSETKNELNWDDISLFQLVRSYCKNIC